MHQYFKPMSKNKQRVIKDYNKLPSEMQEQIKLTYPEGFSEHLIYYTNKDGHLVSALPFETEDKYYLIKMTVEEAEAIIFEDDDYDDAGNLKTDILEAYEDKYPDIDSIDEDEEPSTSNDDSNIII